MTRRTGVGPDAPGGDEAEGIPLRVRLARAVVPGPIRRSYAAKFAVALLLVVLLITGVGVTSYAQIQGIIEGDAETTLRSTATVQADSVTEWVAGMRAQTAGFAAADVYATGDPDRIGSALRDSRRLASSDVVGIHYVDTERGEVVASTDADYEGSTVDAAAPAWRGPIAAATDGDGGSVGMSDTAYERNGRLLMAFAREVRVGGGVLVVVGDVRRDFEQLHGSRPVVTTRLLDASGREVTAPRRTEPSDLADAPAFDDARGGATAIHERESDVLAFAPVEGTDWVVVTAAPKDRLYEASDTVGRNVAVLVASAVAILGAVGFVLGRGTVRPLGRLRERAEAMERGDLDVDLRTYREDEIGRLFVAFANMRDALREQIRESEAARERAEASRRELARQNERLDRFASTVSHDLRNPLNVADGHRGLLAEKLADSDGDAADARFHLEKIEGALDRMAAIVDDVLALAREGATVEATAPVDLESVATDAWRNVESPDASLEVTGTRTLAADQTRLLRVFENLFRNAVEHGSSSVGVEVGATDDGFYVADDGAGIPPDERERVFEYGHTTADDGTGLGLAIVDEIVTAHGWEITVDESEGGGARFVVSGVDGTE